MSAWTVGSSNGSMSVEFSGHSTKSGRSVPPGVDPLRELPGRADVVVQHRPPLGEGVHPLPRDVALHRRDPDGPAPLLLLSGQHGRCGGGCQHAGGCQRRRCAADRRPPVTSHAAVVPRSATRNEVPEVPTHVIAGASGVSTVAKASRPHGKPPHGTAERSASTATQQQAAHTGHAGSVATRARATPRRP